MSTKTANICLFTLVFLSFLAGAHDFSLLGNDHIAHGPLAPECSSCESFEEDSDLFIREGIEPFQPDTISLLSPILSKVLVDQGFVRSIFHPPTSIH